MAGKRKERQSSKKDSQEVWTDAEQEIVEVHNYAQILQQRETLLSKDLTELDSAPHTPDSKKSKNEPSLLDLQNNVVRLLTEKINERADGLEKIIKKNSDGIEALQKSTEFLSREINDIKAELTGLKTSSSTHDKKILDLEAKVNEMERYRRRWNLRLYGLDEREGEDIKKKVVDICAAVLPDERGKFVTEIDVVHRVGRRLDVIQKPRAVILLFRSRHIRDLLWKSAKTSSFLKEKKLRFAEDLTAVDKEIRSQLWPSVEAARKEGKRALLGSGRLWTGRRYL